MKARVSSAVIMMAITVLCMALGRVTRVLYFAACACMCAYELYKNLKDKLGRIPSLLDFDDSMTW